MDTVLYGYAASQPTSPRPGLPPRARLYLLAVALVAGLAGLTAVANAPTAGDAWPTFVLLVCGAAVAHVFATRVTRNQLFHGGMVFTVAAALLLPPQLVLLVCVIPHCVDWVRQRYAWYIQTFNICNYVVSALAASGVAALASPALGTAPDPRVGILAAVAFVGVNHALLAPMLLLARGRRIRDTRLFSFDGTIPDVVLALLGAGTALVLETEPWALPIVLAPLVLIHRALAVPELLAQARTDAKTGLFNCRHFTVSLEEELARAERFARPLSVLVADLDFLRRVNNRHGHLTGDAVLAEVADVLRRELRPYDIAARFGGDEFAILLPETDAAEARALAERIRAAVATHAYAARDGEQVRVTLSVGSATFPRDARDGQELVRRADAALYEAKGGGRDRVARA